MNLLPTKVAGIGVAGTVWRTMTTTVEAEALTNACYDYETKLRTRLMTIAAGEEFNVTIPKGGETWGWRFRWFNYTVTTLESPFFFQQVS